MKKIGKIQMMLIAVLSAIALSVPLVLAQSGGIDQGGDKGPHAGWHGRHHGGRFHGEMFKGLNLTEEQKTQMEQIHKSFNERTQSLREQLRAKHRELRQANEGGTFNEALATQKLTESAGIQAKLMGEQFRLRQELLGVLTPEQKNQLEQKREQFKQKREQFKSRRGQQKGA
jgi:periplasmic protein CpxP/Spy